MVEELDLQLPSPLMRFPIDNVGGCILDIKREDLIHLDFGGNKWRKLKYNIQEFMKGGYTNLLTFGGPFSNHIAAVASICNRYHIKCTGIIRGEYRDPDNPTLIKAQEQGMELVHFSKIDYGKKEQSERFRQLVKRYKKPFVIPEGGSNQLALKGVGEIISELGSDNGPYDYIVVSAGTGMTASGLVAKTKGSKIIVMNALKNLGLKSAIQSFLPEPSSDWEINNDYTFGGFAKVPDELVKFANEIYTNYDFKLDPIYNAKAFYGTLDLISKGYFKPEARILYILTGGLQGISAYNYNNKTESKKLIY